MTTGHDLWDAEVWSVFITFFALLAAMFIANCLLRSFKALRRALIPSPVLGGFLLLLFCEAWRAATGTPLLNAGTLETITYHGLGLGFAAVSLKTVEKVKGRRAQRDVFNSSLITVSGYVLQGIVGLILSFGLFYVLGSWPAAGILIPMGFGQGPGQAYNWGHTYEASWGFTNGTSFGLTVAALGYVAASIGGIIYLNILRKKGDKRTLARGEEQHEVITAEMLGSPDELPVSGSMDKFTVQFALVFIAYAIAYGVMSVLSSMCDAAGGFLVTTGKPTFWGFNFIFGAIAAILVRSVLSGLQKKKVLKKKYINNFMLDRISGLMFDMMVVAAIGAIDLSAFERREFVIPLLLICAVAGVLTYFFVRRACKLLFPAYADEEFLAMYGMLTGTASTGVIMLREIDPRFETPACRNLIYQALWTMLLGCPLMLVMGLVAKSTTWLLITLGILTAMFVIFQLLIKNAVRINSKRTDGD